MSNLWTLTKRELFTLFATPSMYGVGAAIAVLYGLVFHDGLIASNQAVLDPVAMTVGILAIFFVPIITMRAFAGETASGTIELLMTAPVRPVEIVLSKYLGCVVYYLTTLLPLGLYMLLLLHYGKPDAGVWWTTLIGLVLLGLNYVALGLLASCLTGNLVVGAAVGVVLIGGFTLAALPARNTETVYDLPAYLSQWQHFRLVFIRGLIDTRTLVYLLSFPPLILFWTWLLVQGRGVLARARGPVDRRWRFASGALALAAALLLLFGVYARMDILGLRPRDMLEQAWRAGVLGALSQLWPPLGAGVLLLAALYALRRSSRAPHGVDPKAATEASAPGDPAPSLPTHLAPNPDGDSDGGPGESLKAPPAGERRPAGLAEATAPGWLRQAAPTAIAALAAAVIAFNLNYLAAAKLHVGSAVAFHRWDWTENQINTLNPNTRKVLDELEAPLRVTVFFSDQGDLYHGVPLLSRTRDLLTEMASYSPRVEVRYFDPFRDAAIAEREGGPLDVTPEMLPQSMVVQYRNRQLTVPAEVMIRKPTWKEEINGITAYAFTGELPLAIAAKRLIDERVTRVYVAQGRGELDAAIDAKRRDACGLWMESLRREGFDIRFFRFDSVGDVPRDCDVLILPAPSLPYGEATLANLERYADHGGRVLLLLPSFRRNEVELEDPMVDLTRRWGGTPRRDQVIDVEKNLRGVQTNPLAGVSQLHPIGRVMERMTVVVPYARSIRIREDAFKEHGWQVSRLLLTPKSAMRADTHRRQREAKAGPHVLAYAAARPATAEHSEGRVIVLHGGQAAANLYFDEVHNRHFLVGAVQWLAGRDYDLAIAERDFVDRGLSLDRGQFRLLFWVAVVAAPIAWGVVGLLVWWRRKE